ncbi:amino acid adenylation domain-containing protein [Algibacter sp. TI.3.09]|uniref:amino acid adenylation domain-containing protein n=1 Tax=Algibacter sp. TI.3.09 TaxID=3121298 RepID=UPI00311D6B89
MKPAYNILGPTLEYPKSTLHELLEKQAIAYPKAVALEFDNEKICYGKLQEDINKTAHYLWSKGVRPGQIIAISLDRSPDLITSIFAVLQCGAAYVPIDASYPTKRLEMIIADSEASYIICKSTKNDLSDTSKNIFIEDIIEGRNDNSSKSLDIIVQPISVAYIIYTSGSTGKPKGVQVSHLNTINLVYSMGVEPGISREDKIFALTTISFDAMVMEVFLPLLHGASIVLVDEETRLDGEILLEKALKDNITMMWGTPSIWQILLDSDWKTPLKIKALIGGEPVPLNLATKLLDLCSELWNIYGPTETTVCAFLTKISKGDTQIAIGKPVANTHAYLIDEKGNHVTKGEVGEIVIGGDGVSLGYLNRPELTTASFVDDLFVANNKMYLSGDLGKLLPNGQMQCLGRRDQQVKVRGHRIELGEIEKVIETLPNIKKNAVLVNNLKSGEPRLVAYLQSATVNQDSNIVRNQLEEILPESMIPSIFIWLNEFPITTNGKIDKEKLPQPEYVRPDSAPLFKKPRTKLEKDIALIWSEQLQVPSIGIDDNFFEMGGTSLLTQKVATLMRKRFKLKIPVTKIYQHPTIKEIATYIENDDKTAPSIDYSKVKKNKASSDVAIIGMAGRFPGAESIDELWDVLKNGKETTSFFTPEELDKSISESLRNDPLYVGARGIVPSVKEFDAKFFGLNKKLAEAMDPQQRLFLEIAWEALEQSGHLPKHYKGSIGVYAGTGTNTYYKNNVLPNKELLKQVGVLQANTVNEKDYISSRTAYHLNLKGPAVSVHSACSTSLLAIAEAADAIRNGRCDVALAGGSSITAPIHSGHLYQEGSMLSPDGHCRSFDENGKGTVFSDGAGVVLLKSLEDAKADGDIIYGVIKGVGLNNDGGNKGSFTAPSTEGQAGAISNALLDAGVQPSEISYIEAHGTATPIGDPIEIEGLKMAFGKQAVNGYCAIGSIKSNMGHLTAAAGVAGMIKTILALKHKQIPASLGFQKPNTSIDFENSPFYVNNKLNAWESDGLRKAGISSFGVGGTNVHIVVEEYKNEQKVSSASRSLQILPWSAKTQNSLQGYQSKLGHYLKTNSDFSLADVAHSLINTRDSFTNRGFVIAENTEDASNKLLLDDNKNIKTNVLSITSSELAFLFPGQGAQYLQMGKSLYTEEKIFKVAVDKCAELLKSYLKLDIRQIIYPDENSEEAELKLKDTKYTQPALFVVEYALSQLWMSWGIKPTLLCGHSVGEFVAAHLAGIFTLEDALHLITMRGKLVSELPGGSMLSVRSNAKHVKNIIPETLSIAAINSDRLIVVSGPDNEIESFSKVLEAENIANKLLLTSHAFHSTMMNPVLDVFETEVKKITLSVPRLPIVSTVTGDWLTDSEATSSEYWTNHLRATVNFSGAMETVLKLEDPLLLEVGPGRALTTLSMQKSGLKSLASIASLSLPKENETAHHSVLSALGTLWLHGVEPNWSSFYGEQTRQKLLLPSYVFDRKPCWVEPLSIPLDANKEINNIVNTKDQSIGLVHNTDYKFMRKPILLNKISEIIEENSGVEIEANDFNHSFLELGLDSLVLTQMAITFKNEFNTPITFRQLNDELGSPNLLADYIDKILPKEVYAPASDVNLVQAQAPENYAAPSAPATQPINVVSNPNQNTALGLIAQQLQLLGKQMELLQGHDSTVVQPQPAPVVQDQKPIIASVIIDPEDLSEDEKKEHQKPFGASPKIEKKSTGVSSSQKTFLDNLIESYNTKTAGSKAYAQKHRSHMSDPRVVSGFKPETKELIYPIVIERSSGNRLWDLDNNEYIDTLNGFGSCLFGHQPDFIKEALHKQIESGYEVGPQHPLAGEVCELLSEFTGHERVALCNTGSEAVLGAMRIARTVTGRSLVVAFSGSYHGINDEALVRGSKKLKTFPAAAGILSQSVQNVLVLEYGTDESLEIIRQRSHELAAVVVEPVQSRRPEFQPIEFLNKVREITKASETALVFDEVITGFRMHPGGAQALFNIKADIAAYGKVIGGGLSIGAIAGNSTCMDAIDGGFWKYGDKSYPEVGVTYFAGTFVRHPLALAASKASLIFMKEQGPELQTRLTAMTESLVSDLILEIKKRKLPIEVNYFGSLWRLKFLEEIPYSELLFVLMREKGIHIWDGFPCFITNAYNEQDINKLKSVFTSCLDELISAGIFNSNNNTLFTASLNKPPLTGARLGMDEKGNPAWFIEDLNVESGFAKIEL